MPNNIRPFPSPPETDEPVDGPIIVQIGGGRFAIAWTITELSPEPAIVIPIRGKRKTKRTRKATQLKPAEAGQKRMAGPGV